jgi:hypothetical protein
VPFVRQVRTITAQLAGVNRNGDPRLCWHIEALNALHEAAESYLVEVFEVRVPEHAVHRELTLASIRMPTRRPHTRSA